MHELIEGDVGNQHPAEPVVDGAARDVRLVAVGVARLQAVNPHFAGEHLTAILHPVFAEVLGQEPRIVLQPQLTIDACFGERNVVLPRGDRLRPKIRFHGLRTGYAVRHQGKQEDQGPPPAAIPSNCSQDHLFHRATLCRRPAALAAERLGPVEHPCPFASTAVELSICRLLAAAECRRYQQVRRRNGNRLTGYRRQRRSGRPPPTQASEGLARAANVRRASRRRRGGRSS